MRPLGGALSSHISDEDRSLNDLIEEVMTRIHRLCEQLDWEPDPEDPDGKAWRVVSGKISFCYNVALPEEARGEIEKKCDKDSKFSKFKNLESVAIDGRWVTITFSARP